MKDATSSRRTVVSCAFAAVAAAVIAGSAGAASDSTKPADDAAAAGAEVPTGRHLFLVPATAPGQAAIKASEARVIARYESFTVVSADGPGAQQLIDAGADRRDDMRVVTAADGAADPASKPALRAAGGPSLALVQFVGPVKDAWLDEVRATGATIVTYIAANAYVVYAPGDQAAAVAELDGAPGVRAVTRFTATDKTAPGIASSGTAAVAVQTLAGAPGAAARGLIAEGERLRGPAVHAGTVTEFAAIDPADVAELAHDPAVVSVEPWVEPELLDERAASIVAGKVNAAGSTLSGPGYLSYLNNSGFPGGLQNDTVDITDEGIDKGVVPVPAGSHPDFFLNGNAAAASRIQYAQEATADADARDCGGHGTNVASIATGFNNGSGAAVEDAQGFNYGLGIAPRAKLGATKIFNCAGNFDVSTSFAALRTFAFAHGARVSNNSWGAAVGGAYSASSQEADFLVRDAQPATPGNQQLTQVFSAGNSGGGANTIGAPGTAKNVITVGASENIRPIGSTDGCGVTDAGANNARDIIDFSSRGPTDDGRIKPDIVAPGTHVAGAQPQTGPDFNGSGTCNPQFPAGSTRYSLVSGTSQAAPEVTGFAALIRDWYRRTVGGGTTNPTPAMIKAIMVNTAVDQVGGNDGAAGTNANIPTQIQGWGRVSLKNLLGGITRQFIDQGPPFDASGETENDVYSAVSSTKPVKVTLVWTDAPGPTSGDAFVNDLDLTVSTGTGAYKGNVFSGGVSIPGGSADQRNNVENVFLPAGVSGPFSVQVRGTNIAGDGVPGNGDATDQDYALIVSNANPAASSPVLTHNGSTVTDVGDADGFLEPGEVFRLTERLRNNGTASATGINGVLSGSARTTVLDDTSAYPNIPAGTTGTNVTTFRVKLADNYVCGRTAQMTLDLTTAQGPRRVKFGIPTGTPLSTNTNSTDVPKPIPDGNPTGASSVLTIAGDPVSITDLNVRIGSITHTFDGDLVISLTGPDSTTVTLSNRRGSSGDNFTNTVFDDEAATAISTGAAPFNGSFRPEAPLSAFDGKSANGTWTLKVVDVASDDTGTINAWGLTHSPRCN